MADLKQCSVCVKSFEPCRTCNKNIDEAFQWRRVVCCPEHFAAHLAIIRYVRGTTDKETASRELKSALDANGEIDFKPSIRAIVNELLPPQSTDNAASKENEVLRGSRSERRFNRRRINNQG